MAYVHVPQVARALLEKQKSCRKIINTVCRNKCASSLLRDIFHLCTCKMKALVERESRACHCPKFLSLVEQFNRGSGHNILLIRLLYLKFFNRSVIK